jgi:hypothetical protein
LAKTRAYGADCVLLAAFETVYGTVIIIAIIAWAWSRKQGAPDASGVPVEAFAHVVEEQARQTEALRSAVEGLSEVVHQIRMLLETRTLCPYGDRRDA